MTSPDDSIVSLEEMKAAPKHSATLGKNKFNDGHVHLDPKNFKAHFSNVSPKENGGKLKVGRLNDMI